MNRKKITAVKCAWYFLADQYFHLFLFFFSVWQPGTMTLSTIKIAKSRENFMQIMLVDMWKA